MNIYASESAPERAHLRRVDPRQCLNVMQDVLHRLGLDGDGVALVEVEAVAERALAEPDTSEGDEEMFVQVVRHPAAILDLTWGSKWSRLLK